MNSKSFDRRELTFIYQLGTQSRTELPEGVNDGHFANLECSETLEDLLDVGYKVPTGGKFFSLGVFSADSFVIVARQLAGLKPIARRVLPPGVAESKFSICWND